MLKQDIAHGLYLMERSLVHRGLVGLVTVVVFKQHLTVAIVRVLPVQLAKNRKDVGIG